MLNKARLWIRKYMPNIDNFEDERVKVEVKFRDVRRYIVFRWLPYLTWQRPKLSIRLYLKESKFQLNTLAIECDPPKHREDSLFQPNFGWFTDKVVINQIYDVTLPKVSRSGNFEYRVNVKMNYEQKEQVFFIYSIGQILTTGKVLDRGMTILSLFWMVLGGILGALIQRFIIN
ncbi:MAG: hypothetical protein V1771_03015 [Chloroflexota bacterium]